MRRRPKRDWDAELRHVNGMFRSTEAHSRSSDPSTSHEAAKRARATKLEATVYKVLLVHFPRYLTSIEIAEEIGKHEWSVSPRMAPLVRKGYAERIKVKARNSEGNTTTLLAWRAVRPEDYVAVPVPEPLRVLPGGNAIEEPA